MGQGTRGGRARSDGGGPEHVGRGPGTRGGGGLEHVGAGPGTQGSEQLVPSWWHEGGRSWVGWYPEVLPVSLGGLFSLPSGVSGALKGIYP